MSLSENGGVRRRSRGRAEEIIIRATILSGDGRYSDPWHAFADTSDRLAEILEIAGFEVDIRVDADDALRDLRGVNLLAVNCGDPWSGLHAAPPFLPPERATVFGELLDHGIGVLGMHASVASLRDYPEWSAAAGAIWLPEESFHPALSRTRIRVDRAGSAAGLDDFDVEDERYCRLQWVGRSTVVASHDGVGVPEPAVWVRDAGRSRVAMDVLGHDTRSYDSPGHRALVRYLARWAARADEAA